MNAWQVPTLLQCLDRVDTLGWLALAFFIMWVVTFVALCWRTFK